MMSGIRGESVSSQPTGGATVASPTVPTDASLAASPVLSRPSPLCAVAPPVQAATTSLRTLLTVVRTLEAQFRASGDAVTASAHLPTSSEGRQQAEPHTSSPSSATFTHASAGAATPASTPSTSAQLLATLEALANATAHGDAEVGQHLVSLRRGVAALTHELHGLSDRYPALQSSSSNNNNNSSYVAGNSWTSQGRTPHIAPSATTPNSFHPGGAVARASISPASPPQRVAVVTPGTSPQLQAGSVGSVGSRLGDSLRSPASIGSFATTPAKAAAGAAISSGAAVPSSAPTRPLPSPGRTAAAITTTTAASPVSPSLGGHADHVDLARLPTAQLPAAACTDSVKTYLANCIEWPPRPRRRTVRVDNTRRRGSSRGVSRSVSSSGDDARDDRINQGLDSGHTTDDALGDDGFRTPATAASRQERGEADSADFAVVLRRRRTSRHATDDFLRRLTAESPYDMSMLRSASRSPDTQQEAPHRHHGSGPGPKGKRMRSRQSHERQRKASLSSSSSVKGVRCGRPTIVESVDALVLAQLRADGIPLTDAMTQELRGCAATSIVGEAGSHGDVDANTQTHTPARAHAQAGKGSAKGKGKVEDEEEEEMVRMAAVPKGQRPRTPLSAATSEEAAVDFAEVLQEIRRLARYGSTSSTSSSDPLTVAGASPQRSFLKASAASPATPLSPVHHSQPHAAAEARKATRTSTPPPLPMPLPSRLPTTSAWLAQMDDFCTLLDDLDANSSITRSHSATSSHSSSASESADEEEGQAGGLGTNSGGRARARHSHTTTTTAATRERMSLNDNSRRSTRSSGQASSSSASPTTSSSSDTATAASENDFSIADELFTSAEEAEEAVEHDESSQHGQHPRPHHHHHRHYHSSQRSAGDSERRGTASHTAGPLTAQSSLADEPSVHGSNPRTARSIDEEDEEEGEAEDEVRTNASRYGQGAPRITSRTYTSGTTGSSQPPFSIASPPQPASPGTATAAAEGTPASRELTHITVFEEFWLERGEVPVSGSASSERLGLYTSATDRQQQQQGAGALGGSAGDQRVASRGTAALNTTAAADATQARATTAPSANRLGSGVASGVRTPGARVLAQRRRHQEAQESHLPPPPQRHHHHSSSLDAPGTFLRERYRYLRELQDEEPANLLRHGTPVKRDSNQRWRQEGRKADEQQQQQQRWPPQRKRANGGSVPLIHYRAAARELRSLAALLSTDLTLLTTLQRLSALLQSTCSDPGSASSPTWPDKHASPTAMAEKKSCDLSSQLTETVAAATQLLLSVQEKHSMQVRIQKELKLRGMTRNAYERAAVEPSASVVKWGSRRFSTAGVTTPLLLSSQHPVSALGYAPLLVQAQVSSTCGSVESGNSNNNNINHLYSGSGANGHCGEGAESQLAQYIATVTPYLIAWRSTSLPRSESAEEVLPGLPPAALPLPLPVWVYVEVVTAELVEEARKLNALYDLYVSLLTQATGCAPEEGPACGGVGERLLHHVRCRGRAVSALTRGGVAGGPPSLDNGLEKFVAPVSAYLLSSFDRLDSRHLLHNVLHEVHLSDVVARRRAQTLQEQQQRMRLMMLSSSSPSQSPNTRPPPRPATSSPQQQQQQQLRSGRGSGVHHNNGNRGEEEVLDSFALPPGTLSSSPALRSAAGVQWSMRDAEQQQQPAFMSAARRLATGGTNGASADRDDADGVASQSHEEEGDPTRSPDVRASGGGVNTSTSDAGRGPNRSGSTGSESRHVIIEGFVRYLTGGVDRLRQRGRGSEEGDVDDDSSDRASPQNTPSSKATPHHPPHHHHHSGQTLDVPHTAALLREMDVKVERATSNLALLRALDGELATQSLMEDALEVRGGLRTYVGLRAAELSRRRYFNSCAAAFAVPVPEPTPETATEADAGNAHVATTTTVVQCRWQPVFQSTMCFCPVTRRRCLDPLVCGALLVKSPLLPQEMVYTPRDHDRESAAQNSGNGSSSNNNGGSSPHHFPVIHALRSGLERAMAARIGGVGAGRPTSGPSVRRAETAVREVTVSPPPAPAPAPVIATTRRTAASSAAAAGRLESPIASLFPGFFLRRTGVLPERAAAAAVPRIVAQSPTTLYGDSAAVAATTSNDSNAEASAADAEDEDEVDVEGEGEEEELWASLMARRLLRIVTLLHEAPPVTQNLLLSPDTSQARWLNPPTLLECGHVVSHKTYLDLRTTARRTTRTAAAAAPITMVVCCPYCSKITPAKDALTLSYIY